MTTDTPIRSTARRGRPRSAQATQAILGATTEILEERGFTALTMEEVAARAGVGKATVYRWWSSKGTLAFDAMVARFLEGQPLPDTGSLHRDLLTALRAWIKAVKGTATGRILAGLIAEVQHDPELSGEWRERFVAVVRDQHRVMLERAIERGEIAAGCDTDVVLDVLYGSAYHRLLQSHLPLTDRFAREVVDLIVAGLTARNVDR
jgi:AcrR family transcriptional regulator